MLFKCALARDPTDESRPRCRNFKSSRTRSAVVETGARSTEPSCKNVEYRSASAAGGDVSKSPSAIMQNACTHAEQMPADMHWEQQRSWHREQLDNMDDRGCVSDSLDV
eukprot:TRINITY_DN2403_c0_g2_i1.p3 TRINITY_DN2403_c0_g2~~TRINITY_DN2403_c0_g2_i1.p3  ORF type:complete len:109 (-),score=9.28 TRINITY_DN2403_c0_g2_i1:23-349(-)